MKARLALCLALPLLAASPALTSEAPGIRTPAGALPEILKGIGPLDGSEVVAVSPDGTRAALARPSARSKSGRTTVELLAPNPEENASLEIPGEVRALLFSLEGSELFALRHKPAKKSPGQTLLIEIDLRTSKSREWMSVPPSARDLAHWPERGAVFIPCADEVRTILLPGPRSGPLYPVLGDNLSAMSLGGSLVLLGQEDGIVLVDLSDRSTREGLPPRERFESQASIVSLAGTRDGSSLLARSSDGRVFRIALDPLTLTEDGTATSLVQTDPVLRSSLTPAPATAASSALQRAEPLVEALAEATPVDQPAPQPTAAETRAPAAPEEAVAVTATAGRIHGRVSGPAAKRVVSVVLLGPNNLLGEARRIPPGPDGRWSADGLEPGRYRVHLDAGGDSVVISDPSFVFIEVPAEGSTEVQEIRAVQIL